MILYHVVVYIIIHLLVGMIVLNYYSIRFHEGGKRLVEEAFQQPQNLKSFFIPQTHEFGPG